MIRKESCSPYTKSCLHLHGDQKKKGNQNPTKPKLMTFEIILNLGIEDQKLKSTCGGRKVEKASPEATGFYAAKRYKSLIPILLLQVGWIHHECPSQRNTALACFLANLKSHFVWRRPLKLKVISLFCEKSSCKLVVALSKPFTIDSQCSKNIRE